MNENEKTERIPVEGETENVVHNEDSGIFDIRLTKPLEAFGKQYETVSLDFSRLTGEDIMDIDRELLREGTIVMLHNLQTEFLAKACVRASGVGEDVLLKLDSRDFLKLVSAARRFFGNAE